MPKSIRTDNGEPFGVPSRDVVPMMSLWLIAWGIRPILNRPRRPTDNSHVENNQRTSANWAEVGKCSNLHELQLKLHEAAHLQRECYQVTRLGGFVRKLFYPALHTQDRKFDNTSFDQQNALQHLAKAVYPRLVSSSGTIALYSKSFSVGIQYKGQAVICQFDPQEIAWKCKINQDQIIKVIPDPRFSKEQLLNLTLYQ